MEYHAISAALLRVEKKLTEEPGEREQLRREVDELKSRLAQVEKKLAELENELRESPDA
jgi:septal ring factor EnvC (AmiA/AmiB activator)